MYNTCHESLTLLYSIHFLQEIAVTVQEVLHTRFGKYLGASHLLAFGWGGVL
jgi:hypothetical protein